VVYSVAWDFKTLSSCKVCFGCENIIDFVRVEKILNFQFVVGEPIGFPEDYTKGVAISLQVFV